MILNPTDVRKHLQFRAPYTPAELNEVREQFFQFNGRLFGLEVIDQPSTVPPSVLVKPGAAIVRDRVIVQLLEEVTIAREALAAPFALVLSTDNEVATTNTELRFVEDQLLLSTDAILAEFDALGLLKQDPGVAFGELRKDVHGGLVDRRIIEAAAGQTIFDTRGLCFSTLKGADLLVFRNGRKVAFNLIGANPTAGWIQAVGGIKYVGTATVVAGEKWEFILDRSISFQERFSANGSTTVFDLTLGTYRPGLGETLVFVDGVYQLPVLDYVETDSDTITFVDPPDSGTVVEVVVTKGTHLFEVFTDVISGQDTLDLANRLERGGHAVLVFKDGLKLLRIDDYVDEGCERIRLTDSGIYGNEYAVYELRTTLRTVLNRELRELVDVSTDLAEAVVDPEGNRSKDASAANPFRTADEVTEEIAAAVAGLTVTEREYREAGAVDFYEIGNVDFDTFTEEATGSKFAKIIGRDNFVSVKASFEFPRFERDVDKIVVPIRFSEAGGTNNATIRVIDSDGTILKTLIAGAPTVRTDFTIVAADLSKQPTNRFLVSVQLNVDNDKEAFVGSVLVEYK